MRTVTQVVGNDHVAREVDDADIALELNGMAFEFQFRRDDRDDMGILRIAFIDLEDPFLALSRGWSPAPDARRELVLSWIFEMTS